jgi:hypothetical protein
MPAYALLCLAPALWMRLSPLPLARREGLMKESPISWQSWVVVMLILVQFGMGRYDPKRVTPTAWMKKSGDHLLQEIASVDGPVLVMMHPYYTVLAGKEPSSQIATIWYVRHRGELPMPKDFQSRIQNHYYSEIISDESFFETQPDFYQLLRTYYVPSKKLNSAESPPTITGVVVRPKLIYLPKGP